MIVSCALFTLYYCVLNTIILVLFSLPFASVLTWCLMDDKSWQAIKQRSVRDRARWCYSHAVSLTSLNMTFLFSAEHHRCVSQRHRDGRAVGWTSDKNTKRTASEGVREKWPAHTQAHTKMQGKTGAPAADGCKSPYGGRREVKAPTCPRNGADTYVCS